MAQQARLTGRTTMEGQSKRWFRLRRQRTTACDVVHEVDAKCVRKGCRRCGVKLLKIGRAAGKQPRIAPNRTRNTCGNTRCSENMTRSPSRKHQRRSEAGDGVGEDHSEGEAVGRGGHFDGLARGHTDRHAVHQRVRSAFGGRRDNVPAPGSPPCPNPLRRT